MNADKSAAVHDNIELEKLVLQLRSLALSLQENLFCLYGLTGKEVGCDTTGGLSGLIFGSFNIAGIKINNPVIAAPMAGISDNSYRIFARVFGCALSYSEMATSYGLIYGHEKSFDITRITDVERPCAVQIFGSDPDVIAEAAAMVEENADIIDINMGCPVPKVLKTKSGGYLLNEPETIGRIIKVAREKIKKPLTVKLRLGWDENNINIIDTARIAESQGADAISIHGRTVKQGYSGKADYEYIRKVKGAVNIPVIASGDIDSAVKAAQVLGYTGCNGLMIGRAARGNPWIFAEISTGLLKIGLAGSEAGNENHWAVATGAKSDMQPVYSSPGNSMKADAMKLYLKTLICFKGEDRAVREFRKIIGWAFKGQRDIASIRNGFFKINTYEDAEEILDSLR